MRILFLGILVTFFISCQKEEKYNTNQQLTFEDVSKEFGLNIKYTESFKEKLLNRFGSVEKYKVFLSERIAENKNRKIHLYRRPSYSYFKILLYNPSSYMGEVMIYAPSDMIILDSAIEYGLDMPYGCRCGFDYESLGFVLRGGVSHEQLTILEDEYIENGYTLLDVSVPISDCEIVYGQSVINAFYEGYPYVDGLGRGYEGKYSAKTLNNE